MKHIILFAFLAFSCCAHSQTDTMYWLGKYNVPNADSFSYAVIGDYGTNSKSEDLVAKMVLSWKPLFIVTTGDNDYEDKCKTCRNDDTHSWIDSNISKYYGSYIHKDAAGDRFFPGLGNHDQPASAERADVIKKYFALFPFLHDAKDYDFVWGPIHFYSINSGPNGERGNITESSLKDLKKKSTRDKEPFHIAFFHHPQYASGLPPMPVQDHFAGYNLDAILNGHIHYYERLKDTVNNIQYLTIGCSGRDDSRCSEDKIYGLGIADCKCLDGTPPGAVKVTVVKHQATDGKSSWVMTFKYYSIASAEAQDVVTVVK